ncbi:RAB6-interacting golgin-like [Haliotis rubra]|uniref:RAB6-interacting golgin-like n=1 Tax=Haliotis rubra TaxID=36100 RepID=UPI001EE5E052|nr:RAB6-interacting golgin-like [Haliotis rubra]
MAGWAGFSDEDLRRIKQSSNGGADTAAFRQAQFKKQQVPNKDRIVRNSKGHGAAASGNLTQLDPSQRLVQPEEPKVKANGKGPRGTDQGRPKPSARQDVDKLDKQQEEEVSSEKQTDLGQKVEHEPPSEDKGSMRELDETEAIGVELDNMARFQKQQKMIEEANKQKRLFLANAINERKKKAKAESVKLTKIQSELGRLDTLLSVDVGVIRDKIEAASMDYTEAQRRYTRAEQEFINAKMDLFHKGELKERLTEHLYTIIHQNEVRKANKLAELMKQLEMEVAEEEMEVSVPTIPMLSNFNSVTTLPNPALKSPVHSPEVVKTIDLSNKDSSKESTDSVPTKSPEAETGKSESGADNSSQTQAGTNTETKPGSSVEGQCNELSEKPDESKTVVSSDISKDVPQKQDAVSSSVNKAASSSQDVGVAQQT